MDAWGCGGDGIALFEFVGADVFFVEFVGGFGAFEGSDPREDGGDAAASAGRGGTRSIGGGGGGPGRA